MKEISKLSKVGIALGVSLVVTGVFVGLIISETATLILSAVGFIASLTFVVHGILFGHK